jgi:hypothetical protein
VAAFLVSPFGAAERTWKPFNPVLGETFEADALPNDAFFVAEQARAVCSVRVLCVCVAAGVLLAAGGWVVRTLPPCSHHAAADSCCCCTLHARTHTHLHTPTGEPPPARERRARREHGVGV